MKKVTIEIKGPHKSPYEDSVEPLEQLIQEKEIERFQLKILHAESDETLGYVKFVDRDYAQISASGDVFVAYELSGDIFYQMKSGNASGLYLGITPNHWIYAVSQRLAPPWIFKDEYFVQTSTNQPMSSKKAQIGEWLAAWEYRGYKPLRITKDHLRSKDEPS